ncbi:Nramp family divalent metal transporter [Sphaerochaeta sp. PS]|uniref:Nramp family divalent metal transporter n=1 Tax=Sphaerochaeta sp. PS TaxID=3076336 RepID=UPI0028A3E7F2|nr:Nramp family divalent metal transporter [Sphaerochaeta sp. PS]MDT4762134.1 Nramp family divalent metal transporter [Sphaerochaeta sp. PS]
MQEKGKLKKILSFLGPGFLITVGFIDPGNWATNIEGGSRFGYTLLWVITLSTLMLMVIQHTAAKLGIATGKSLAVNIREHLPKPITAIVGLTVVGACVATDVAELLGAAIGFQLLFRLPLWFGALLTVFLEVFLIVGQRYHKLERTIIGFLGVIALCYLAELILVKPDWGQALPSFVVPRLSSSSIYIAMGMIGAVVMPHNIFLHSNVIHSRQWGIDDKEKLSLLKYERIDTTTSLVLGLLVNGAMIIVAAKVFHGNGLVITSIEEASKTLVPLAGPLAGFFFAVALVFSGVGSSVTSSMAEVNVITGFLGQPEDPKTLLYRVATFVTAIPSFLIILLGMDTYKILIFSQVILSIQLPFTLIPLLYLCRKKKIMGAFKSSVLEFSAMIGISAVVILLNMYLLYSTFSGGV